MAETKTNAVRMVETHKLPYTLHTYPCKEAVDGVTVAGMLANGLVLIPAYQALMGMRAEDILAMGTAVHPGIDSIWKLVVFIAGPFNLLKGGVLSALTAVMYKRISPLLHEGTAGTTERKST